MATYEFKKRLEDINYHHKEALEYSKPTNYIFVYCVKNKRLLAKISKEFPYCFELTAQMQQEFWAEDEKADELVQLILDYSRTSPDNR